MSEVLSYFDARNRSHAESRQWLGLSIWTMLVIVDAFVMARRLSGQFVLPIPPWLALATMILIASLSWLAWWLTNDRFETEFNRSLSVGFFLSIDFVWLSAITANGSPALFGVLLGMILVHALLSVPAMLGYETALYRTVIGWLRPSETTMDSAPVIPLPPNSEIEFDKEQSMAKDEPSEAMPEMPVTLVAESGIIEIGPSEFEESEGFEESERCELEECEVEPDDHNQTLWLTRQYEDGGELIEGWVRVGFVAGQRETQVHVAFCPPLATTPEIETEDLDGVGLEVRIAAAFPFGARLSVRRSDALDEEHTLRVGFAARAHSLPRAA